MPETETTASCSFCLKPHTEVARLVAGPGVYICNECVALCAELVDGPRASAPRVAPWEGVDSVDAALAFLGPAATVTARVDSTLTAWVARSRELGATWAQIGEALGVTRQSAWGRFATRM